MSDPIDYDTAALVDAENAVTALVDDVFVSLGAIASRTRALWVDLDAAGTAPSSADLAALHDVVTGELQRQGTRFNGAGLVVDDGILADGRRYLQWWQRDSKRSESAQPLHLDLNPNSEYYYDYTTMEWFAVPRDRGIRWVYGPYLDYTGVDLYVCTFAVPVTSTNGVFLGVAGADVPVASIDAALLPTFTSGPHPVALANAEGRVIVANHADHVTGSKIRARNTPGVRKIPDTPWSLIPL